MKAYFNGIELTERFLLSDLSRPIPGTDVETVGVSGRDGVLIKSVKLLPGAVSFTLWPHWMNESELREAVRELAAIMAVKEPAKLEFSDDDGLYYMAIPNDVMAVREFVDAFAVDCAFILPSPAMYGVERTVTVPSGGSVTFNVGGTYPTKPVITANATRNSSSQVWGIRLDERDFIHIATGSASARTVAVDCNERTCVVNSSVSMITLDSDWLELEPGMHTLRMDNGTGAATVTFRERWL